MKFEIVKYTKDRIADVIEFEKRLRQEEDFWGWEINEEYKNNVPRFIPRLTPYRK